MTLLAAYTAATLGLLAMGTDTLTMDLIAGVATPLAKVPLLSADLTAVAGLLRPTADAAAATRFVGLGSLTICAARAISLLV